MRPQPTLVDLGGAERGPMRQTIDARGKTRVKDMYVVRAPVHGNLSRVERRPGDVLVEGDVLAHIEAIAAPLLDASQRDELHARARASRAAERQAVGGVETAKSRLSFAQADFERAKSLHDQGALPTSKFEAAQRAVDMAGKELESARFGARVAGHEKHMAQSAAARADRKPGSSAGPTSEDVLEIETPVAGRILRILRRDEGVVQPGEALVELADLRQLEVVVDLLTTDAVQVSVGDEVELLHWGDERSLHGRVRLVEPAAFTRVSALGVEEQRVNVVIDLKEDPEERERLGDGFALDVKIVIWSEPEVLKLPLSALFRDGDDWACFVVNEGLSEVRPLELGHRNDFEVEVISGLEPTSEVVLHPADALRGGVQVASRG